MKSKCLSFAPIQHAMTPQKAIEHKHLPFFLSFFSFFFLSLSFILGAVVVLSSQIFFLFRLSLFLSCLGESNKTKKTNRKQKTYTDRNDSSPFSLSLLVFYHHKEEEEARREEDKRSTTRRQRLLEPHFSILSLFFFFEEKKKKKKIIIIIIAIIRSPTEEEKKGGNKRNEEKKKNREDKPRSRRKRRQA